MKLAVASDGTRLKDQRRLFTFRGESECAADTNDADERAKGRGAGGQGRGGAGLADRGEGAQGWRTGERGRSAAARW